MYNTCLYIYTFPLVMLGLRGHSGISTDNPTKSSLFPWRYTTSHMTLRKSHDFNKHSTCTTLTSVLSLARIQKSLDCFMKH